MGVVRVAAVLRFFCVPHFHDALASGFEFLPAQKRRNIALELQNVEAVLAIIDLELPPSERRLDATAWPQQVLEGELAS